MHRWWHQGHAWCESLSLEGVYRKEDGGHVRDFSCFGRQVMRFFFTGVSSRASRATSSLILLSHSDVNLVRLVQVNTESGHHLMAHKPSQAWLRLW